MTRIRTVLTAAVFWLGLAGAVVAIVLEELGGYVDHPAVSAIVGVLAPIGTIIAVLVAIIRRVTPVIPEQRGLLPSPSIDFTLNGQTVTTVRPQLSYADLRALAGFGPTTLPSIAWRTSDSRSGTLVPGSLVDVGPDLIVSAVYTGNA